MDGWSFRFLGAERGRSYITLIRSDGPLQSPILQSILLLDIDLDLLESVMAEKCFRPRWRSPEGQQSQD